MTRMEILLTCTITEKTLAAGDAETACINSKIIFEKCQGCFIEQIILQADYDHDELSISFFPAPGLGKINIFLRRVRYFSIEKPPELNGSFVDDIRATHLPTGDEPWPAGAEKMVGRFSGLPDLIWLEVIGPTGIEVICEAMSVTHDASEIA